MRFIVLLILLSSMGCGTHPGNRTPEKKTEEIRNFFADVLDPPPDLETSEIPFKAACLNHLVALYDIINDRELLLKSGIPQEIIDSVPDDFDQLKGHSLETILKALMDQGPEFFQDNQANIENAVKRFKFSLNQLKSIKIPKLGTSWTRFFQNILNNYFPKLALEDKKRILAYMIRHLRAENTETQHLLNWVYASGPFFQKYLQLMAEYLEPGNDPFLKELKEGLDNVKDGLPHIDPYYLDLYRAELKAKGIYLGKLKSVGAASVGEAFLTTEQKTGKQMVVKFMRPGIEDIAKREHQFFTSQARSGALKESFDEIARQIKEELDYTTEVKKIKEGIPAYEGDDYQIHVVRPIDSFPNSKKYFAMEYVDGFTFKKLEETELGKITKSILWEKITRKFLQQAMFAKNNAFFHGDLHPGNIMATFAPDHNLSDYPTRKEVEEAIKRGKIKVVLIDFGNAHTLSQNQRLRLKNMFMAASKISNSAGAFLDSIMDDVCPLRESLLRDLENKVFNEKNEEKLAPEKMGEAMDILLANDIAIPGFLMAFFRTVGMLVKIHSQLEAEGTPKLDPVFTDGYLNNIPDLLRDTTPAGIQNMKAVFKQFVRGKAAVLEFELMNRSGSPGEHDYDVWRQEKGKQLAEWIPEDAYAYLLRSLQFGLSWR